MTRFSCLQVGAVVLGSVVVVVVVVALVGGGCVGVAHALQDTACITGMFAFQVFVHMLHIPSPCVSPGLDLVADIRFLASCGSLTLNPSTPIPGTCFAGDGGNPLASAPLRA